MGTALSKSKPPPQDIDLLPPRFERRPTPLDKLPVSPLDYLFGSEQRDKLFGSYFAEPGGATIRASLRPDYDERALVSLQTSVSGAKGGADDFSVGLGYTDTDTASNPLNLAWQGQVRMGSDGSVRGVASAWDPARGIGGYALLPGEHFLNRRYGGVASPSPPSPTRGGPVGYGLGGMPVRYTHAVRSGGSGPDASSSASASPVSPRAVTAAAADAADASTGRAGASSPVVPEAGLRYVDPSERFSIGGHVGFAPTSALPVKVWAVGSGGASGSGARITAGIQLVTDAARLQRPLSSGAASSSSSPSSSSSSLLLAPPGQGRFDVDAAVSLGQAPHYEVSLALDSVRREVVAGYSHALTVRRRVYNPLEPGHVKGIYQYVDLGFELRRQLEAPFASTLALAGSVQLNKGALVKLRVGSRDVSASLALKTWTDPAATLCATTVWDRARGESGVGIFFALEKGGALDYRKQVLGQQTVASHRALKAAPHLNERITAAVDQASFEMPAGARGRGGADGGRFM
jgi:hypothetical protein